MHFMSTKTRVWRRGNSQSERVSDCGTGVESKERRSNDRGWKADGWRVEGARSVDDWRAERWRPQRGAASVAIAIGMIFNFTSEAGDERQLQSSGASCSRCATWPCVSTASSRSTACRSNCRQGQILGLIGPNGAGKTTLFNCLSRLYTPTSGDVLFEGREHSRPSAARHGGDRHRPHLPERRAVPAPDRARQRADRRTLRTPTAISSATRCGCPWARRTEKRARGNGRRN